MTSLILEFVGWLLGFSAIVGMFWIVSPGLAVGFLLFVTLAIVVGAIDHHFFMERHNSRSSYGSTKSSDDSTGAFVAGMVVGSVISDSSSSDSGGSE